MPTSLRPLKRPELWVCLLLLLATIVVYWPLPQQDFINLDDDRYVTENSQLQQGLTGEGVIWAFSNTSQVKLWLPLTWLSLMLDYDLFGLYAGGYKVTNLFFHLLNTLLLFGLLKKLTGRMWRSAMVAALFALHPLHVESVAWVTERKDVLSTLFWLLTMLAYLHYLRRPGLGRYLLMVLALTLGLLAKPMLVTLPLVLLLLDYWPLNRFPPRLGRADAGPPDGAVGRGGKSPPVVQLLLEKAPLLVLAVAAALIAIIAQRNAGAVGAMAPLADLPLSARLANALVSYLGYIGKLFWPSDLAVLYPHPGRSLPLGEVAGAGLVLLLISWLAWREARRHPYLLVGWLWYLTTLLPVIGLIQVGPQAMADRFTYVPLIGLFITLAWGIPELSAGWRWRRLALSLLAGVALCVVIVLSWRQVRLWENGRTLYTHTLRVTGNNLFIQNNLGLTLLQEGRDEEAIACFAEALKLAPDDADVYNNLGLARAHQGRYQEASRSYVAALEIAPDHLYARNNLGVALLELGRAEAAIAQFSEALRRQPDYAEARDNLRRAEARRERF